MLNRRTLFSATAGMVSVLGAAFGNRAAHAKSTSGDVAFDVEVRSKVGRLERLPTLNAESRNDFLTGVRNWRGDTLLPAARERFNELLADAGQDIEEGLSVKKIVKIVGDDPIVNLESRVRIDAQRLAHKIFRHSFESQAEAYLAELEAYDASGPGTLELNPDFAAAANNLAYIYSEHDGNAEKALELAQRAREIAPATSTTASTA